jgi:hypothetical protein
MLWVDRLLIPALKGRGKLTNAEIYSKVKSRARREHIKLSPSWQATVRNTLQRHCKHHPKARNHPHYFVHHNKGLWECRE